MVHTKTMQFPGLWVAALALFSAASEAQVALPSTGQLCISDCATCPVICTAPPPPQSYSTYIPPPSPPEFSDEYMAPPLPKASPGLTWPPPQAPRSYFFWGPPPPARNYLLGAQPSGQMPRTAGPRDYSYPYYYFYSSNSCSFSSLSTFAVLFVCVLHFLF